MGISGNLQTMALAELLQWLAEGSKTGTLRLDNGKVEKRIHFFDGRIVSTASTDPKERLGHFLVSHGYIGETELAKAMEMQESNKMLLGKILTTIGLISEDDLDRMIYLKSEETIYDLFSWKEGEFQFLDGELPEKTLQPIDLNVTSLVFRGTQRLDEWGRIRQYIPSAQAVPVSVAAITSDDPAEAAVLEAIDDDRTIAEIAMHTHSSEFHVCRILVDHIEAGRIKVVRPRGVSTQQVATEVSPAEASSVEGLLTKAERLLDDDQYLAALRHLRAAKSLDPEKKSVVQAVADGERAIREVLLRAGIELTKVPRISSEVTDVSQLDISPDEGFILSRINGSMDIQTIITISPMAPLEAELVFFRLNNAGYIELGEKPKR